MTDAIILLKKFRSDFEAQLAKTKLESEGIPSMVMSDDAGGMEPQFQFIRGVSLMVRREDAEAAREILEAETEA
jgi:hypothetical protein